MKKIVDINERKQLADKLEALNDKLDLGHGCIIVKDKDNIVLDGNYTLKEIIFIFDTLAAFYPDVIWTEGIHDGI